MDCLGLVYVFFKEENIVLLRILRDMVIKGIFIFINEIVEGDFLFF